MTFLLSEGILSESMRLYRQSNLDGQDYSWILKTFSSVHFTTVHANSIEQTTISIELVVWKRCILVVIRKDSTCLLLHRTSTNFVVKRDLQNFGSTCGFLRKSFWRHNMKNTWPHLKPSQSQACRFDTSIHERKALMSTWVSCLWASSRAYSWAPEWFWLVSVDFRQQSAFSFVWINPRCFRRYTEFYHYADVMVHALRKRSSPTSRDALQGFAQ